MGTFSRALETAEHSHCFVFEGESPNPINRQILDTTLPSAVGIEVNVYERILGSITVRWNIPFLALQPPKLCRGYLYWARLGPQPSTPARRKQARQN